MTITSINPATGELLETFPETSGAELDRILTRAVAAFSDWSRCPVAARTGPLGEAARLLRERKHRYARTMALEMGKPLAQGEAEAEKCAWACDYYAEHAEQFLAAVARPTDARTSYVRFDSLGPAPQEDGAGARRERSLHRARRREPRRGRPHGGRGAALEQRPELHRREAVHRGGARLRPVSRAVRGRGGGAPAGRPARGGHGCGPAGARRSAREPAAAGRGSASAPGGTWGGRRGSPRDRGALFGRPPPARGG